MGYHVHVITASPLAFLPRLLPAPQAFLAPTRPSRLPPNNNVDTIGVYSGNIRRHLNYFGEILHSPDTLKAYSLQEVTVEHTYRRDQTIRSAPFGPTGTLSQFGALLSLGLIGFSLAMGDGTAVFAICLLSLTSTLTGVGSRWCVLLQKRLERRDGIPKGDVVLKTSKGAFVLVHCNEEVARELYFGQESMLYMLSERWFRVTAGAGTFSLMAAVVFLANCTWELQAAIAITYILLNSFYWFAAVLPPKWGWDMGMYKLTKQSAESVSDFDTYTKVVTEIVKRTKSVGWLRESEVLPKTEAWTEWIDEAEKNCHNSEWDGSRALSEIFKARAAKHTPRNDGDLVAGNGSDNAV